MEASLREEGEFLVSRLERRAWSEVCLPRREMVATRRGMGEVLSAAIWRAAVIAWLSFEMAFGL